MAQGTLLPVTLDVHTHAFHPKIAQKVLVQLESHYGIVPVGTGQADDLLDRLDRAGIARAAVHAAATAPAQVIPANNWAIDMARTHPRLIPFGTMHPGYADFEDELDDPALLPILEAMRGRFTAMFHVGDRLPPDANPSCPRKLASIHREFPGLTIIAAHLGGLMHWDLVLEELAGSEVYIDTSSSLPFIEDPQLHAILDRHPPERVLFGSDYPLFDPGEELRAIESRLGLSSARMELLLTAGESLFAPIDGAPRNF